MGNSLYRFSEVQAKKATPATVQESIRKLLADNDDACYVEMERYLRGNANTGSRAFDHAHCVNILLQHDKMDGGMLHVAMQEKGLSEMEIWERLTRVLRTAGFKMHNGKLTGTILEDMSSEETTETE